MITQLSDFSYPSVKVPNNTANTAEGNALQAYINKYETKYLRDMLGVTLYDLFIAGIDADDAIYTAIRDGGEFTDIDGIVKQWEGFVSGSNPIANYIYWHWLRDNQSTATTMGVRQPDSENSTAADATRKMVDAWNEMVQYNFLLNGYLYANRVHYSSYIGLKYSPYYYDSYNIRPFNALFIGQNVFGI